MVILALLIGLAAGAAGVYLVAVRRAILDRDRAADDAREARSALAEAEGALAAERGAFDNRVETAIRALSTEALRENANAFTEQAMGRLGEYVEPLKKSLEKVETNVEPARAAAPACLRRDPQGARDRPADARRPAHADGKSRQCAARRIPHARPLG